MSKSCDYRASNLRLHALHTEGTAILGTPSVVEVAAAETTVSFEELNTVTSITPGVFTLDLSATTLPADGTFALTVNGAEVAATNSFETTFIYPGTTLELSFSSRQVAFQFTGEGSTEITNPGEHTHLTVDGIETAVDIPGITTTLTVTGSTNVIVGVPETVTQMTIPSVEYVFSAITDTITEDGGTKYCGDQTLAAGDAGSTCVMGTIFTVTLPSDVSPLYLHLGGLTTSFAISGITTTFVPEQTITIVKDGSTETSVIPAVVSSYVTTYWKYGAEWSALIV